MGTDVVSRKASSVQASSGMRGEGLGCDSDRHVEAGQQCPTRQLFQRTGCVALLKQKLHHSTCFDP